MKRERITTPAGASARNDRQFIGKTLGYTARFFGFHQARYRVYVLDGQDACGGSLAAEDYELKRIVQMHPDLKGHRIASIEDYYGIRIFRVRAKT